VTFDLLTDSNAPIAASRIAASEVRVRTALSNNDPIIEYDFVQAGNVNMRNLAKVISAILPEVEMESVALLGQPSKPTDPRSMQQVVYQGMRDGVLAVLARVVDVENHDALRFPLEAAMRNAGYLADILGSTGSGSGATLTLAPPPRGYFDGNPAFYPAACAPSLSDLECFEFQYFIR